MRPTSAVSSLGTGGSASLDGAVWWQDSNKVAGGAHIVVERVDNESRAPIQPVLARKEFTADPEGNFEVTGMELGYYSVAAISDVGAGTASLRIDEEGSEHHVDIMLRRSGSIAGHVVNEAGKPVAGATVCPRRGRIGKQDAGMGGSAVRAQTDEAGAFTVSNVCEGEWSFLVVAEGYAPFVSEYFATGTMDVEFVARSGGAVSGTVMDAETKAPAPGVKLVVTGEKEPWVGSPEMTSDDAGAFGLEHLADNSYTIRTTDRERQIIVGPQPQFAITGANQVSNLEIVVSAGGVVSGRAYDADTARPLEGVPIQATPLSAELPGREVKTDADGEYRIEGLGAGSYRIGREWVRGYLHGERREDKTVNVELGRETDGVDFPMKYSLFMRGRVKDESGEPIRAARVSAISLSVTDVGENVESRKDGTFEVRGFSPFMDVQLTVVKMGYVSASPGPLKFADVDINDVEIVLKRGGSISGIVVDPSGSPLEGMEVYAVTNSATAGGRPTDAQGAFKVEGLSPGDYSIQARERRREGSPPPLTPVGSTTLSERQNITGLRLIYTPKPASQDGLTIEGLITNRQGEPIKDANAQASSTDGSGGYAYTLSDDNGRFVLKGLKEGMYRFTVYHHEYSYYPETEIAAGSRSITVVLDKQSVIEGKALDARTGRPITSFQAGVIGGDAAALDTWILGASANQGQALAKYVDPDGAFRLTAPYSGGVVVLVSAPEYGRGGVLLDNLKPGQTVTGLTIQLAPGAIVEGTVRDEVGKAVLGASIAVGAVGNPNQPNSYPGDQPGSTKTDSNGAYRIEGLSGQPISVRADHGAYLPTAAEVTPVPGRSTRVDLVMGTGGVIKGTVTLAGKPVSGAGVSFWSGTTNRGTQATSDSNGEYTLSGLSDGHGTVSASVQGQDGRTSRSIAVPVTVEVGAETVVNLAVPAGASALTGRITVAGKVPRAAHFSISASFDGGGSASYSVQVTSGGLYRVDELAAGPYSANASALGPDGQWRAAAFSVELGSGSETRRDVDVAQEAPAAEPG